MKKLVIYCYLLYLRILARLQLAKMRLRNPSFKIVGISGSAGKTSTMMAVDAMLRDQMLVKTSYKANSETGIPLDLFNVHPKDFSAFDWLKMTTLATLRLFTLWPQYDVYVVELGVDAIDEPKNMRYLLKILVPDVAVYLNVNAIHAANYEKQKGLSEDELIDIIAADKALLIGALPKDGLAVLNADDKRVAQSQSLAKCPVKLISARDFPKQIELPGYLLASHFQHTFYSALAVAEQFGVTHEQALGSLRKNFKLEAGRCSVFEGKYDSTIIDSSYNSSPEPTIDMLDLLHAEGDKLHAKTIAVLGDVRELGSATRAEHERLARYAHDKADMLYLVGPAMRDYFIPELLKQGFTAAKVKHYLRASDCAAELLRVLEQMAGPKVILVKGSQNTIFLEIVVAQLLAHPEDTQKLCRRGKFWDNERKDF